MRERNIVARHGGRLVVMALLLTLAGTPPPVRAGDAGAAERPKGIAAFRDTLDGKFDMSRHLAEAHGFMPVPIIITEPALGGFGGGLALVFLARPPGADSTGGLVGRPDMTAVAGAYTANDSSFAGGGRIATLPKKHLRYRAGAGRLDMNIDFYQDLPVGRGPGLPLQPPLDSPASSRWRASCGTPASACPRSTCWPQWTCAWTRPASCRTSSTRPGSSRR